MKKKIAVRLLMFFMLVGGVSFLKTAPILAAYVSSVADLKQTGAAKNSITIEWSPSEEAVEYHVYYKDNLTEKEYRLSGKTADTKYTITGLKDGITYNVQVKAFDGTTESSPRTIYDAVTLPDRIEGLQQDRWYYFLHVLDIKWNRKSGVSGYEVSLSDSKGKVLQKKDVSTASVSFNNLKDSVYTIAVRAYTVYQNNKYYSAYSSINCIPQARISKLKLKGGKLTMNWKKVDGATGYKIYVSTKPNKGYKLAKTVGKKKSSCTIAKIKKTKIKSKKTYYVYVQTVCNKGKNKGTSGALYYWSTKNSSFGYLN